ncbi:hypothetical protein C8F01DRAFT_1095523, partial [Mycena amicta]
MTPSVLRADEHAADSDAPIADWSDTEKSASPEVKPLPVPASIVQTRAQKKKAAAEQQTPSKSSDKDAPVLDTRGHADDHVRALDLKTSASAGLDPNPSVVNTQRTLEVIKAPAALKAQGYSASDYEAFLEYMKTQHEHQTKASAPSKDAGVVVVGPNASNSSSPKRPVQAKKGAKRKHDAFDDVFSGPVQTSPE